MTRLVGIGLWVWVAACSPGPGRSNADEPNPPVWVQIRAGTYSCRGATEFQATSDGQLALESDARAKGYRPAARKLCGDGTMLAVPDSASRALSAIPLPDSPVPEVWVNTRSGVYHCPGSRWFKATAAGRLMSQRAAQA